MNNFHLSNRVRKTEMSIENLREAQSEKNSDFFGPNLSFANIFRWDLALFSHFLFLRGYTPITRLSTHLRISTFIYSSIQLIQYTYVITDRVYELSTYNVSKRVFLCDFFFFFLVQRENCSCPFS
uniref:Uncharacterized protein n=1 Tax=Cacopsylla melanoneura TaxID=428564 RepID=A0A8D8TDR6_9HEMI